MAIAKISCLLLTVLALHSGKSIQAAILSEECKVIWLMGSVWSEEKRNKFQSFIGKCVATAQIHDDTVIDCFKNCQIVV